MDRFVVKRKRTDADVGFSSQPGPSSGQNHGSTLVSLHIEINLDELLYDPANWKRIQQYTNNPRKQGEIRRIYLTRGPYRPRSSFFYQEHTRPRFKYPQKVLANTP
jgi:hypothetical protein